MRRKTVEHGKFFWESKKLLFAFEHIQKALTAVGQQFNFFDEDDWPHIGIAFDKINEDVKQCTGEPKKKAKSMVDSWFLLITIFGIFNGRKAEIWSSVDSFSWLSWRMLDKVVSRSFPSSGLAWTARVDVPGFTEAMITLLYADKESESATWCSGFSLFDNIAGEFTKDGGDKSSFRKKAIHVKELAGSPLPTKLVVSIGDDLA